jgi:hypothetical protein
MIKILLYLIITINNKSNSTIYYLELSCGGGKWYGWYGGEINLGIKGVTSFTFCEIGYGFSFGYTRYSHNDLTVSFLDTGISGLVGKRFFSKILIGLEGTIGFVPYSDPPFFLASYKVLATIRLNRKITFSIWYKPWIWNFKDYQSFGINIGIPKIFSKK